MYNDIALIRLEQAVSDVTPIPILPDLPGFRLTQADVGTLDVLFVGYGNTSLNPLVVSTGVRMRMNDTLDYFCEDESGCDPFDFGWSMGNHTAVFAPAQNEPASAGGDSGGPDLFNEMASNTPRSSIPGVMMSSSRVSISMFAEPWMSPPIMIG